MQRKEVKHFRKILKNKLLNEGKMIRKAGHRVILDLGLFLHNDELPIFKPWLIEDLNTLSQLKEQYRLTRKRQRVYL